MNFDEIYKKSLEYLRNRISKQNLSCDPEECLNEAYLQLIDEKKEIVINSLLKKANHIADTYSIKQRFRTEFSSGRSISRICCKCKADIPSAYFGITENNHLGRRTLQNYCRDCQRDYFKSYFNKNRIAWNLKMKDRYRTEKETLHDNYIKKYLRTYGWKVNDITNEVINYYRKKMAEKRTNPSLVINYKIG